MKLKLLAADNKMINNHDALMQGAVRYIGRRWDPNLPGFPPTGVEEVNTKYPEHYAAYIRAVQEGDLIAADQDTAEKCGVPFVTDKKTKK